jgi:Raf kinase inhibitor-like YbhB/YbcL family protein
MIRHELTIDLGAPVSLQLTSRDFVSGQRLADRHAADRENVPPSLFVTGIPDGTVELALIVHDPDAPLPYGFTHWLQYGIDPVAGELHREGVQHRDGENGFGTYGWGGPLPPSGHGIHHYYFWIYALSEPVQGEPGRQEFLSRYADRILAQQRLVGVYSRP